MIQEEGISRLPETGEPWPPWPGEAIEAGEHEVFVRSVGDPGSSPALFVHGLGGSSSNWTDLMGLLSGRVYARALDLPGFGCSRPPEDFGYTFDEHVGIVVDLISTQRLGPVHLFGNSMGGAIATRIAAEHPELVRTLTLISPALPTLRPHGDNALVALLAVPGLGGRLTNHMHRQTSEELVASQMNRIFYDTSRAPEQRIEGAVRELAQTLEHGWTDKALTRSTRGLISAYLTRGPRSLWRQVASVQAPTLLVWGRHDALVSASLAESAAAAFPDSRLLMVENAGHMAQIERPTSVSRAFVNLLDDVEHGRQL